MLTDDDVLRMLQTGKRIHGGFRAQILRMNLAGNTSHRRSSSAVKGDDGKAYWVKLRQSIENVFDFSVILVVEYDGRQLILRRYNGRSHEHKNPIEKNRFYDYHIHTASQRYHERGFSPECYAERTDRYATIAEAVDCLLQDCGFYYDASATALFSETDE